LCLSEEEVQERRKSKRPSKHTKRFAYHKLGEPSINQVNCNNPMSPPVPAILNVVQSLLEQQQVVMTMIISLLPNVHCATNPPIVSTSFDRAFVRVVFYYFYQFRIKKHRWHVTLSHCPCYPYLSMDDSAVFVMGVGRSHLRAHVYTALRCQELRGMFIWMDGWLVGWGAVAKKERNTKKAKPEISELWWNHCSY
jgi:hypothetical protein